MDFVAFVSELYHNFLIPVKLNSTRWKSFVSGRSEISVVLVVVESESEASGVSIASGRFANGARRREENHFTALVSAMVDSTVSVLAVSSQ